MRTVYSVSREVKTLNKRERERGDLRGCRPLKSGELDDPSSIYTSYSPATFVKKGVPVSLFSMEDHAGVIIPTNGRRLDYWYDGKREHLTSETRFRNPKNLDNGEATGQLWNVSERRIETELQARLDQRFADIDRELGAMQRRGECDKYGVLRSHERSKVSFSWNEGTLRYRKGEIGGFLVNPESKNSAKKALRLRHSLRLLHLPIYEYNCDSSTRRVPSVELMRRYNLKADGSDIAPPAAGGSRRGGTFAMMPSMRGDRGGGAGREPGY